LQEHGVRRRPGTSPQLNDVDRRGARLVLVGHGGTNAVALEYLLGLDGVPWPWERFNSNHASITRVRTTPLGGGYIFGLFRFNDVAHLARADRTR
jgi:broad specificity phosphatase PhoE